MRKKFLTFLLQADFRLNENRMKKAFSGKCILITGASFGIGEELTLFLSRYKTKLVLMARTEEKLLALKEKVTANGSEASIFSLDMRDKSKLAEALESIKKMPIEMVFSNAGKSIRRSIFDSLDRLHDFERTMALNYIAPIQLILELLPKLIENKGHLVNISTINALFPPVPKWAAYQASKVAFDQWFRSVGMELRAKNVRVHSVYLPLVKTRMIKPTKEYDDTPALPPTLAAKVALRSVYKNKLNYMPLWQYLAHVTFSIFRNFLEKYASRFLKF